MTRTERALMMRVARLEATVREQRKAIDDFCDDVLTEFLDRLERLKFVTDILLAEVNDEDPITTAVELDTAKISYDLGLPRVEKEGE